jgi:hypothetical protein
VADVELPNDTGALEFGAVKAALGDWIDAELDHGFAVHDQDDFLVYLREHGLRHVALAEPPTTEAITALIAAKAYELLGVRPVRVHVMEGYRNAATWYDS